MRAAVRSISSPDVDVSTYSSTSPDDDGLLLTLYVGPADGPGEESFDLLVCTPLWMRRRVEDRGPLIGRHHLIMEPMDLAAAQAFVTDCVEQMEAPTWPELAQKLARIGHWEFEDYKP